jgi:hypothetical protein
MALPEIPEGDLLRAVLLARVRTAAEERYAVTWDLTDNSVFLHERIMRLVIDEDTPLQETVRLRLLKILFEEVNHQNEFLFSGEIADVRRYLEYLRVMGFDVSVLVSNLVRIEKDMNAVIDKVKRSESGKSTSAKEAILALGPVIREFNKVKDNLKSLRHAVDQKAEEALRIYSRKVDVEAAERLFKVLTQEL